MRNRLTARLAGSKTTSTAAASDINESLNRVAHTCKFKIHLVFLGVLPSRPEKLCILSDVHDHMVTMSHGNFGHMDMMCT